MLRRTALLVVMGLTLALLTPAADAAPTLQLDTFSTTANPSATTSSPLTSGTQYVVTVSGTYSRWSASTWANLKGYYDICGTPEAAPVTASPSTVNGPVGADAETFFAQPVSLKSGGCAAVTVPRHASSLQVDLGAGFMHLEPVEGAFGTPAPQHTYAYLVTGAGAPASFRIVDAVATDNYGVLDIEIHEHESETLSLDTFRANNSANPATDPSAFAFAAGRTYDVTVSGTYSRWLAKNWSSSIYHTKCGTTNPAPATASPGTTNGEVGSDAETHFAVVRSLKTGPACSVNPPPTHSSLFQSNLGGTWTHLEAVGGPFSSPSVGNAYSYVMVGQGAPVTFRIADGTTNDNYGVLTVQVQERVASS
jgi:hypothetical protein